MDVQCGTSDSLLLSDLAFSLLFPTVITKELPMIFLTAVESVLPVVLLIALGFALDSAAGLPIRSPPTSRG